jgi:hypothetical protein
MVDLLKEEIGRSRLRPGYGAPGMNAEKTDREVRATDPHRKRRQDYRINRINLLKS